MKNINPNVIFLTDEEIRMDKFCSCVKQDWDYECTYEKSEEEKYMNYQFRYNDLSFILSVFPTRFREDMNSDIQNSQYSPCGMEIYTHHTNFCILTVFGDDTTDINMIYVNFTRMVMSLFISQESKQSLIYDIRSGQVIDKEIYITMLDHMKSWSKNNEIIFPVDWYVNYLVLKNEDKVTLATLGFEAFNDYEIEIINQKLDIGELISIMKFIVINVISRHDKIKNMDLVSVPVSEAYEEAVVKKDHSKVFNKDILVVIF